MFQILDGSAVVAFGLGLVAEAQGPGVSLAGHFVEAPCEGVVAILRSGDFEIVSEGPGSWGRWDFRRAGRWRH